MNNILTWNVRGLNKARKQIEVARFISSHNISLFGLLEMKVKQKDLVPFTKNYVPRGASPTIWHGIRGEGLL